MNVRTLPRPNWSHLAPPAILVALALLFELTLFTVWRPFGLAPDPLLVVVTCVALFKGPEWGAAAGLAGGYFVDLAVGELVGLTALSKMCVGLGFGSLARIFFPNHLLVLLCSIPAATLLDQLVYVLGLKAFGFPVPPVGVLLGAILSLALLNLVVGIPFYVYPFRRWRGGRGGGEWQGSRTTSIG